MTEEESDTGNRAAPVQLKALASERRRRIMFVLATGSASAAALAEQLRAPKGSVIYHLEVLERAGMVVRNGTRTVRGGTQVTWRVAAPAFEGETGEAGIRARVAVLHSLATQLGQSSTPRLFIGQMRLHNAGREEAAAILKRALAEIRTLEDPTGTMTTVSSFVFGESPDDA
ncbi:winged helix-turn-helix domain-containing protein [Microbacterium sp. NPDC076911]|uniref:ArsR/SmtB family transcription factor n=1 Tax=Microbacterium sp. NPDC076911 TaxID=3154958 RepID=UPI00343BFBA2